MGVQNAVTTLELEVMLASGQSKTSSKCATN